MSLVFNRRLDSAASVVATNDYVLDQKYFDGVLEHRKAVNVCVDNQIGYIAMHEELARQQTYYFVCRDTAIGTTDPKIFGRLLTGKILKETTIRLGHALGPVAIVIE